MSTWPCHIGEEQTWWSLGVFILIYCPNKLNSIFLDLESEKAVRRCSYNCLFIYWNLLHWNENVASRFCSIQTKLKLLKQNQNIETTSSFQSRHVAFFKWWQLFIVTWSIITKLKSSARPNSQSRPWFFTNCMYIRRHSVTWLWRSFHLLIRHCQSLTGILYSCFWYFFFPVGCSVSRISFPVRVSWCVWS